MKRANAFKWPHEAWLHVAFWLLAWLVFNSPLLDARVYSLKTKLGTLWLPSIFWTVCNMLLFYANALWLMPGFLRKGKPLLYVALLMVLLAAISSIEAYSDRFFWNLYIKDREFWFDRGVFFQNGLYNACVLLLSYTYSYIKDSIQYTQRQRQLTEEKLSAELQFLRAQVNPHFLFNTLNNLFSLARREKAEGTSTGMAKLAHLMRYMLYDSNAPAVPLEKEVGYIQDFITLQKLRFSESHDISIKFEVLGNVQAVQVPSLLLIPFVENAFKHGISFRQASYIHLQLQAQPDLLTFIVKNSLNPHAQTEEYQEPASGVGLENVRRRLALLYPHKHDLEIISTETKFETRLTLLLP
ncbi:sensor histidine kinase [Rufibacter ruber]|uniref:sensor histidine kinase n=1 Tax=Rufibacter ruber TaxID=1783499 RepID=UPI000B0670F1|nr:histidine kinase [Rufibacter ruber]